jgi:protein arginine kinase
MSKWFETSGDSGDIAISTRVRLARNLKDYPFPGRMDEKQQRKVLDDISGVLCESAGGSEFSLTDLTAIDRIKANAMCERHLISPELVQKSGIRGTVLSKDESVSVMINEEDHLRIQVMGPGLCLDKCMEEADRIDDLLESRFSFAFSEKLGYLTHCPTNLGTGLRASVMLHLPMLTEAGEIQGYINAAGKLGYAIRGLYGEGTKAIGAMYQVSNQLTLGLSEKETLEKLRDIVSKIIDREQQLRQSVREKNPGALEDAAWRALGLLGTARRVSTSEAMENISRLRLGVAMGEIHGVSAGDINRLIWEIQPNCIMSESGILNDNERDVKRADILRRALREALIQS